jgi:DNA mismatch repair protein MutS2
MQTSANLLEFEALRELLGRYVASPLGAAELAVLEPHTDRALLEAGLAEAGEAIQYQRTSIRLQFGGLPDVTEAVHKLHIEGAALEPREISDLYALLDRAADAKSLLLAAAERFPRLSARARSIGDFRLLLRELSGKILLDGSVADGASVALARIRR